MKIVMFYHSLISDWNHGNAHFLRGIVSELLSRGHQVDVYEPCDAWSVQNLVSEHGTAPVERFHAAYPQLRSIRYWLSEGGSDPLAGMAGHGPVALDLNEALDGADLVIVHEWNDHDLVRRIGEHRARVGGYRLLFHDTHHRAVTQPEQMASYDLSEYDGVLAFGRVLRDIYVGRGWAKQAWIWHEAADARVFRPLPKSNREGDLVWVGNWGDEERTAELHQYLLGPVRELGLTARVHGVRYPQHAMDALREAGIEYGGWLANFAAPATFARFSVTVHVPRRPYVEALPGIPTIRVFEALSCGIPLVCSPWDDAEHLFTPGKDYLVARSGSEMTRHLRDIIEDRGLSGAFAAHGRETILARHTCAHRVDELMNIYRSLSPGAATAGTVLTEGKA